MTFHSNAILLCLLAMSLAAGSEAAKGMMGMTGMTGKKGMTDMTMKPDCVQFSNCKIIYGGECEEECEEEGDTRCTADACLKDCECKWTTEGDCSQDETCTTEFNGKCKKTCQEVEGVIGCDKDACGQDCECEYPIQESESGCLQSETCKVIYDGTCVKECKEEGNIRCNADACPQEDCKCQWKQDDSECLQTKECTGSGVGGGKNLFNGICKKHCKEVKYVSKCSHISCMGSGSVYDCACQYPDTYGDWCIQTIKCEAKGGTCVQDCKEVNQEITCDKKLCVGKDCKCRHPFRCDTTWRCRSLGREEEGKCVKKKDCQENGEIKCDKRACEKKDCVCKYKRH